ncbi:hypothetical protein EI94DRAFT_1706258, partial [Lactarius quietus]
MNALLTVTSRVEAAMASYNSLARPIANEETWRRHFKEERAKFPEEISHLLPSSGEFWWEALIQCSCRGSIGSTLKALPRIRLLPPTQPPAPQVAVENVSMDVDELAGTTMS